MFKFLKEKIKNAISNIGKKVEEIPKKEAAEEEVKTEEIKEVIPKEKPKKNIFEKLKETITTVKIDENKFEDLFHELEFVLLENNTAVDVIDKIKEDLKNELVDKPLTRKEIRHVVVDSLRKSIEGLFVQDINLIEKIKKRKPFVIVFIGLNGSGKTTTIAKMAKMLMDKGLKCVLVASDTFRAGSIQQLEEHANKLGVKLIKHQYGADPAAVAFDGVKHAKAKNLDVVLIDTAGRQHSNRNLMDEMKKIVKVVQPDMKIFVGESITGNDCIEQSVQFNEAVGIDGIILSKADVDEKGGAAISISYVIKKPILYLGVGQGYDDLEEFNVNRVMATLGF